jgi:hypothetical protein
MHKAKLTDHRSESARSIGSTFACRCAYWETLRVGWRIVQFTIGSGEHLPGMIRNRVTEEDVRDYLGQHGYVRGSIRFEYMELVAIQRPGWVQVFKFHAQAKSERGEVRSLFGVVRDDQRNSLEVFVGDDIDVQVRMAEKWSEGLITSTRKPLGMIQCILLVVAAMFLVIAFCSALLTRAESFEF